MIIGSQGLTTSEGKFGMSTHHIQLLVSKTHFIIVAVLLLLEGHFSILPYFGSIFTLMLPRRMKMPKLACFTQIVVSIA